MSRISNVTRGEGQLAACLFLALLAAALGTDGVRAQVSPSPAAIDSLRASADQGDADAQYEYGRLYELGAEGISVDYSTASAWYQRAAEQEHVPAMLSASTMLLGSDPQEAMRVVQRAAELGSAEAQWRVGQVYAGRIFVPLVEINRDREEALRWFQLGADQGHGRSIEAIADLYTDTEDESRYADAVALYERAAETGGSAWSVLRLGMIHAIGEGVEQSDATAQDWLSKLGSGYELDPDLFSNEELEVLGGLQAYYGLNFLGGSAERDAVGAVESFTRALESAGTPMSRPLLHSSFQRVPQRMLRRLEN